MISMPSILAKRFFLSLISQSGNKENLDLRGAESEFDWQSRGENSMMEVSQS
jgi:hypothetical protein